MRPVTNKNESLTIDKFSRFIKKFTMVFMLATVFIAYLNVISRNANLMDDYQDFDVGYVTTDPSLLGNFQLQMFRGVSQISIVINWYQYYHLLSL